MTICIGSLCEKGEIAIVASDRMVTSSFPPIEFEHTQRKIFKLTNSCVIATAGDALKPIDLLNKIKDIVSKTPNVETIAFGVKECYQYLRALAAEDAFLKPRTLTSEVFYKRGTSLFPPDLFNFIDNQFSRFDFGLDILLVGTDSCKGHIYTIRNPGISDCFDKIGFHAIGIGALHALQIFIAHQYDVNYSVEQALSVVYAAKRAAEVAPGVGKENDILIITNEGTIEVNNEIKKILIELYEKYHKAPVEEMKEKSKELKQMLENIKNQVKQCSQIDDTGEKNDKKNNS